MKIIDYLKNNIGAEETEILTDIFSFGSLDYRKEDGNIVIPHLGKRRIVSLKLLNLKKDFKLSSPVKHKIVDPLHGIKFEEREAAVIFEKSRQEEIINIATPDYSVRVTDDTLQIDGLQLINRNGNLNITYSSPIIYGLDKNYKINFSFFTKDGTLTNVLFSIYLLDQKRDKRFLLHSSSLNTIDVHQQSSIDGIRGEKLQKALLIIQALYHQQVQTKESEFFDEAIDFIEKIIMLKEQDKDSEDYQIQFQEKLPNLLSFIKDWLSEIAQSIENDFYMENNEVQRLINARTSISSKLSGGK